MVAIAIIWASVAISIAVITTAIMSPGVSVVVGNLFDLRVRESGTIQRERGHGVGRAGTRKIPRSIDRQQVTWANNALRSPWFRLLRI